MKAQGLYDLREDFGFCAGTDLHDFFQVECGDPSPSGAADVDLSRARDFVTACCAALEANGTPRDEAWRALVAFDDGRTSYAGEPFDSGDSPSRPAVDALVGQRQYA